MQGNTQAKRRIQALQAFANDQSFSMISFCLNLPFGGKKLLEQMLRSLAEYHTENCFYFDHCDRLVCDRLVCDGYQGY